MMYVLQHVVQVCFEYIWYFEHVIHAIAKSVQVANKRRNYYNKY